MWLLLLSPSQASGLAYHILLLLPGIPRMPDSLPHIEKMLQLKSELCMKFAHIAETNTIFLPSSF